MREIQNNFVDARYSLLVVQMNDGSVNLTHSDTRIGQKVLAQKETGQFGVGPHHHDRHTDKHVDNKCQREEDEEQVVACDTSPIGERGTYADQMIHTLFGLYQK